MPTTAACPPRPALPALPLSPAAPTPRRRRPSQGQLVLPFLETLDALGGRATPGEVAEALADRIGLTAEERTARTFAGPARGEVPAWARTVRFIREKAKALGFVAAAAPGVWAMTPEGRDGLRNATPGMVVTVYVTDAGEALWATCESALRVLTPGYALALSSPPFPDLGNAKRNYAGQLDERAWHRWMLDVLAQVHGVLADDATLVLELGPRFVKGTPAHHSLYRERLYCALEDDLGFRAAQQFTWVSPTRPPSAAEWVCVRKVRAKSITSHVMAFVKGNPTWDTTQARVPYSAAMQQRLAAGGEARARVKPSGYAMKAGAFAQDNGGALPSDVLTLAHSASNDAYLRHCRAHGLTPHPARMPEGLAEQMIAMMTRPGQRVLDVFGGRGTVGRVAERLQREWTTIERAGTYVAGGAALFADAPGFADLLGCPGVPPHLVAR